MPDERLITEIENILNTVVELGAEKERTRMVPNLLVTDASPTGLSNFIIVKDDRDGDNILATKVPGIIYNTNDLVNVLFIRGGEAIAFQQGSGSSSSGLWEIVLGSSTDIYYNAGDVVIGKTSEPDAALEIVDSGQAQLRLTHTDATKFADFTLDTNHDLTIDPSSTGQIILAADDVTIGEDLIHSGDPDTKIIFTDDRISFDAGAINLLRLTETTQDIAEIGDISGAGDVDVNINSDRLFVRGSDGAIGFSDTTLPSTYTFYHETQSAVQLRTSSNSVSCVFIGQTSNGTKGTPTATGNGRILMRFSGGGYDGSAFTDAQGAIDVISNQAFTAANQGTRMVFYTTENNTTSLTERMRIDNDGDIKIGPAGTPTAQLHIDQSDTGAGEAVILLDQADTDQPFVRYVGTAAAATLNRSIVDEGDVTTATRQGWVKVYVQDDGNQISDQGYYMPIYSLA